MRERRVKHYTSKNPQIGPGCADMTAPSFTTNQVDRSPEWHQKNNDRAEESDQAEPQGRKDGDAVAL